VNYFERAEPTVWEAASGAWRTGRGALRTATRCRPSGGA